MKNVKKLSRIKLIFGVKLGAGKLIPENEKSRSDSESRIVRASNRSLVSNVCKIDRSSSLGGAVSRTLRVYAPSKLIGLHRPLHISRIYISAFEFPRSRFLRQFRYYLSTRHGSLNPRNFTPPLGPSRPIEKTGPVQTGVSNVCERDEMQTGAILFIVRRLYTYRALPVLGVQGWTECRQGRIYLFYNLKTSTS